MPPKIYVVRHAQGYHNIERRHHLRDPNITELGHEQCKQLRATFKHHDDVDIVMASPLTRTIETAAYSFGPALARPEVPFLLIPTAQEIANQPCDIGQDPEVLEAQIADLFSLDGQESSGETLLFDPAKIDYSLMHSGWNSKSGVYEASYRAVEARAAALRAWLFQRSEKTIVLVSHGAFLHYFSEDWTFFDGAKGTAYENCEVRRFRFSEESTAHEAHVVEDGVDVKVKQGRPPGVHAHVLSGIDEVEKRGKVAPEHSQL